MEKTIIDGTTFAIFYAFAFIFFMMLMFYISLRDKLKILSYDIEHNKNSIKENRDTLRDIQRDIWKLK